ncbi:MAG: transketolase family protein [Deltaproteobacteria bacterium]|nr:transketolase family protein [Candidatus Zymogenaceae bacterium]
MAEGSVTWSLQDADHMTAAEIYGETLVHLGEEREDIVALTADLAKSTKIGKFETRFPDRFINVGIAEQNLFGIGAGLALAGFTPFISTFAVFASLRAGEQVRTDICYQNLNCKIIATHSGVSFGQAGTTHHCTEDLSVMRSFANMTVIVPADGIETSKAVEACVDWKGPVYIRIGRGFEPWVHKDANYAFEIGKGIEMHPGSDITVIACGTSVYAAVDAAEVLEKEDGLSVRVIDMHTIKPIDRDIIMKAVEETRRIVTFEDHNIIGGLGSAVSEVIVESGKGCAFKRVGIPDEYSIVGYPEDLYNHFKLDTDGVIETVREVMGKEFEEDEDWEDEI